ncbi:MAG TPA: hypothetical protein VNL16_03165 [Chloroflexota bacterium]|nr:hypothetical protein [Chloroflexota bacterium]
MSMVTRGTERVTEHGILVPLENFAQEVGLDDAFSRVPFGMKTVIHAPREKLAELLCHIWGGGMDVKDSEASAHPLTEDLAVAAAWGQASFASASGVNALLRKATPQIVVALKTGLNDVLTPHRQRVLRQVTSPWIVVDLDLMGLVVSDQASTYDGGRLWLYGRNRRAGHGVSVRAGPTGDRP